MAKMLDCPSFVTVVDGKEIRTEYTYHARAAWDSLGSDERAMWWDILGERHLWKQHVEKLSPADFDAYCDALVTTGNLAADNAAMKAALVEVAVTAGRARLAAMRPAETGKVVLHVNTAAGTNAGKVAEGYAIDGTAWHGAVDRLTGEGWGLVLITCDDQAVADAVNEMMADDDDIVAVR